MLTCSVVPARLGNSDVARLQFQNREMLAWNVAHQSLLLGSLLFIKYNCWLFEFEQSQGFPPSLNRDKHPACVLPQLYTTLHFGYWDMSTKLLSSNRGRVCSMSNVHKILIYQVMQSNLGFLSKVVFSLTACAVLALEEVWGVCGR